MHAKETEVTDKPANVGDSVFIAQNRITSEAGKPVLRILTFEEARVARIESDHFIVEPLSNSGPFQPGACLVKTEGGFLFAEWSFPSDSKTLTVNRPDLDWIRSVKKRIPFRDQSDFTTLDMTNLEFRTKNERGRLSATFTMTLNRDFDIGNRKLTLNVGARYLNEGLLIPLTIDRRGRVRSANRRMRGRLSVGGKRPRQTLVPAGTPLVLRIKFRGELKNPLFGFRNGTLLGDYPEPGGEGGGINRIRIGLTMAGVHAGHPNVIEATGTEFRKTRKEFTVNFQEFFVPPISRP